MNDYELHLKVKNAPMLNMMRSFGYKTANDLSRASGVANTIIGKMLALQYPLFIKDRHGRPTGTIRDTYLKLAEHLLCDPKELVPESHWYEGLEKNTFTAQVDMAQMQMMVHKSTQDPAKFLEHMEEVESLTIEEMVEGSNLSDREKKVLLWRFRDDKTLKECGDLVGVTSERIRHLEARALRKMRHPRCSENLRSHLEQMEDENE